MNTSKKLWAYADASVSSTWVIWTVWILVYDRGRMSCGSGFSQVERHEDTVRVEHVVRERRALHEAMAPVERLRRQKIIPRARLEAQARHAACSCSRNDVAQHRASRSPSAQGLNRVH